TPSSPRRVSPFRPAGCPALPPQVPAPIPRRIPRPDVLGLGARLQMGDAPALAAGIAACGLRRVDAQVRLRRSRSPRDTRRAALAPRHAVLVRENGVARCATGARRRADFCRRPVRLPARSWWAPSALRTLG